VTSVLGAQASVVATPHGEGALLKRRQLSPQLLRRLELPCQPGAEQRSGGRYAHQPVRLIYFADVEPVWLGELAKR
jgi:hypothetical protein